ncbi:MAG: hypothetical protein ACOC3Z_02470 [Nanoarchaeota archaeon]
MKRGIQLIIIGIFLISLVSSQCNLDTTLISQDPYPAIPGDYVKLVFELSGIQDPDCGKINFELIEDYPIHFDPNDSSITSVNSGVYIEDYKQTLLAPYKVRIDKNALDGENLIKTRYYLDKSNSYIRKNFNLTVDEVRADFEVFVKDYDYSTNTLTLEILNTAENSVEALTIEIPKQESIDVKGANRNIIGDLDSNDYTTADFEAIPSNGEIKLNIFYTDEVNTRRNITKTIEFDSSYFEDRKTNEESVSVSVYVIIILIILGIAYWYYRIIKKRKKKKKRLQNN